MNSILAKIQAVKQSVKNAQVANKLAMTEAKVQGHEAIIQELHQTIERLRRVKHRPAPAPTKPRARLKGDKVRVTIADTHGCHVDRPALAAALGTVKMLDPHEVILMGDHVDCGGFLAQHHVMGYVAETAYTYEQDIADANAFLDGVQKAAARAHIEYLEGNHERRPETWSVTQTLRNARDANFLTELVSPYRLLDLKKRGIPYHRCNEFHDGLDMRGVIRRDKCFFLHGFTTARHASYVTRLRTAGNVVYGHTHRSESNLGRAAGTGTTGAWNAGCLCHRQPMWRHTDPTDWTHGIGVQFISHTGKFLHLNVPIIDGESLINPLLRPEA